MAKVSIFGVLSNVQMLLLSLFKGRFVGQDVFGNRYYRAKALKGYNHERRWVIYPKRLEASTVPAEWHGWLHHQTDATPKDTAKYRKAWQLPWQPNLTGTPDAYMPPAMKGEARQANTADYTPWQPN